MTDPRREPQLLELATALRASVIPLSRALRSTDTDLTPTRLSVLGAIYRNRLISMGELAEKERLSPAMVSKVVTALVDEGLVERIESEEDRRVCRVRVSDAGERWIDMSRTQRNAWLVERLSRLELSQLDTLAAAAPLLEMLVGDDHG